MVMVQIAIPMMGQIGTIPMKITLMVSAINLQLCQKNRSKASCEYVLITYFKAYFVQGGLCP